MKIILKLNNSQTVRFPPTIFTISLKSLKQQNNQTNLKTFLQLVENSKHPHSFLSHTIQTVTVLQLLLPCLSKALTS